MAVLAEKGDPRGIVQEVKIWRKELKIKARMETRIVEIGLNTRKGPWDLERLAVTQISVEDHLLGLEGKTDREYL